MEQRRLRLGDTLDDYCPRERRVTNHAIVAMIEDEIKQTRCTTCDAEHAYKGARVPRRRKKETPASLFKEVLAGLTDTEPAPVLSAPATVAHGPVAHDAEAAGEPADDRDQRAAEPLAEAVQEDPPADEPDAADAQLEPAGSEDWPMHRPLIRAQLPRIEGHKEERRPTDFTIRQPGARPNFRGDGRSRFRGPAGGSGGGNGNNSRGHSGQRFAGGGRPSGSGRGPSGGPGRGPARGPSSGFRGGPPRQGNGKKRSR